ncbi:MAG: SUMF1/EgtB/PvdO family nonheme iron enzyme [Anaerolineaceae bacterium]|nr:SUMF1/EgtB/PvdO family nonheme iron enzyme [Anaerolineaceae bacterium]
MKDFIGKHIDRYRVTERLGLGGMAVVYKAYDTRLERDVAIKIIRSEAIPPEHYSRLMKRFEREAKAQAAFDHKNIITVFDYGEVDGAPYLVMAYIPGNTLKTRTGRPIPYQQALRWLIPMADALSYAHKRNVIHRDIKPSNILFDDEDQPILTDFGIAKILESTEATLTGTGLGVGTPEYMAPEQWRGQASPATDQYALGVVLYELLTGQKPFTADTPAAIILMQAIDPLRSPRELAPSIPEGVEKLLYKALSRQPEDRYADMAAFGRALAGQLAAAEPEAAVPAPQPAPSRMRSSAPPNTDSESVTVDFLEATPIEAAQRPAKPTPDPKISTERSIIKRFPAWLPWVGAVLIGIALVLAGWSAKPSLKAQSPITTRVNPNDLAVMVYVPEGNFTMGSNNNNANEREKPEHIVFLDTYYIYQHEVTNAQFAKFTKSTGYETDAEKDGSSHVIIDDKWEKTPGVYWAEPEGPGSDIVGRESHPVVHVSWNDAQAYCQWAGTRLPTEAEWENAARGTDRRIYPWGNASPSCEKANFSGCVGGTTPVGSYPLGASPYGAMDMAGNAFEWVSDWYRQDYYKFADDQNPTGPDDGIFRIYRGGAWSSNIFNLRVTNRPRIYPETTMSRFGFRCATSAGNRP